MPHPTTMSVKLACTLRTLSDLEGYVPDHVTAFRVGLLPGDLRGVREILASRGLCRTTDHCMCVTELGRQVLQKLLPSITLADKGA